MAKRSKHQERIIRNYYKNIDAIALQKLGEQVTNLYLAETPAARAKVWRTIETALRNLKLPESRIEHLRKKDDPALLAKLVEELMSRK